MILLTSKWRSTYVYTGVYAGRYTSIYCNIITYCTLFYCFQHMKHKIIKIFDPYFSQFIFKICFVIVFLVSHGFYWSHYQSQTSSKAEAFTQAFLKSSIQQHTRHDLKSMLSHKAVVLGYSRPKKDKSKRNSKKAKGLNACEKRAMKIFQLKPEHQRWVRNLKDGTLTMSYMETKMFVW